MAILMIIAIIFLGILVLMFPVLGLILLVQGVYLNNIEQILKDCFEIYNKEEI